MTKMAIINFKDGSTSDELNPLISISINNGFHDYEIAETCDCCWHLDNVASIDIVEENPVVLLAKGGVE